MLEDVHVLVVDPDEDTRDMYAYELARQGAKVTMASTLGSALASFRREPPDVLVSDVTLEAWEDGYALVRAVRALGADAGGNVPAVAVTGWARPRDRARALEAGFTAYHPKPCSPAVLAGLVAQQIEAARRVRAHAADLRREQRELRTRLEQRRLELEVQRERLESRRQKPSEDA